MTSPTGTDQASAPVASVWSLIGRRVVHFSHSTDSSRILVAALRTNHSASRPWTVGWVNYLTFSPKSNCLAGGNVSKSTAHAFSSDQISHCFLGRRDRFLTFHPAQSLAESLRTKSRAKLMALLLSLGSQWAKSDVGDLHQDHGAGDSNFSERRPNILRNPPSLP